MVVENVSKISGEMAFESLYNAAKTQNNKKYYYCLFIVLVGVAGLLFGLLGNQPMFLTTGGIFITFGIGMAIYNSFIIFKLPKSIKKNNEDIIEHGVTYNYKFREQSIELLINVNGKKSKGSYKYDEFKKIEEYEDRYILRLKDGDLVYVLKNGFENERMIEFFVKNVSLNKLKIVAKKNPTNK